ncbi:MAG: nitroreductase family protein, partial [Bacteroidales bacterium]|nr:nitroreductase family protein [Bacteroidales bacterium]
MKKILVLVAVIATVLVSGENTFAQTKNTAALDVIMSRASVRNFTGEAVTKEQLEIILKAGMAAPTAMNIQPWRFVVVTDKDKIAEVFGAGPRSGMFKTAGAVIVVCGQTTVKRKPFGQPDAPEQEMPNM